MLVRNSERQISVSVSVSAEILEIELIFRFRLHKIDIPVSAEISVQNCAEIFGWRYVIYYSDFGSCLKVFFHSLSGSLWK
jgi:hypothetical protein